MQSQFYLVCLGGSDSNTFHQVIYGDGVLMSVPQRGSSSGVAEVQRNCYTACQLCRLEQYTDWVLSGV